MKKILLIIALALCIFQMGANATVIDIGAAAIDRDFEFPAGYTAISKDNPANASGTLTQCKVYVWEAVEGLIIATFYNVGGTNFTARDHQHIGSLAAYGLRTFAINLNVVADDYIGAYWSSGTITWSGSGYGGVWDVLADKTNSSNITYSLNIGDAFSIYATGATPILIPTVTTQACDEVGTEQVDGNGNITATGGANCSRRGFCYMEGTSGDPTTANDTAYDDGTFGTGIFSKTITGLSPDTSYRVRAYAVNVTGTGYGATVQTKTNSAGILWNGVTITKWNGIPITIPLNTQ